MTKARRKCSRCREWFQFNIQRDRAMCPTCGLINDTTARVGSMMKDLGDDIFRFRRQ